jgi:hypothetical protein
VSTEWELREGGMDCEVAVSSEVRSTAGAIKEVWSGSRGGFKTNSRASVCSQYV